VLKIFSSVKNVKRLVRASFFFNESWYNAYGLNIFVKYLKVCAEIYLTSVKMLKRTKRVPGNLRSVAGQTHTHETSHNLEDT
jgi:hypothetical protein